MVNGAPNLRLTDGVPMVLTDGFWYLPLVTSQIPSVIWPIKVTKHSVSAKMKYQYMSINFVFFERRFVHPGLGQLGTGHPPINWRAMAKCPYWNSYRWNSQGQIAIISPVTLSQCYTAKLPTWIFQQRPLREKRAKFSLFTLSKCYTAKVI